MTPASWRDDDVERIIAILGRHSDYQAALREIRGTVRDCDSNLLSKLFARRKLMRPGLYLRQPLAAPNTWAPPPVDLDDAVETERKTDPAPATVPPPVAAPVPDDVKRLIDATRKEPLSLEELCDELDMSPARVKSLVDQARALGNQIHVAHNHIGIAPTVDERIQNVGVAPVVGERQIVGVISDTHFGSKYCLREQIVEFVHHAYERGAREILHPGDLVDGMYRHGLWEVSHMGLDAQADDLLDTLPQLPGLNYRAITGNHDETFEDGSGVGFGQYLTMRARERGRGDIHFYGRRSAFIRVGGAIVHLWHPRGSLSYAKSYKLQKIIEKYSSGEKPHLLLVGHFHQTCHVLERGVHGFLCPTFQGGGSAFGKSLGGAPTIGGMILSWEMTEGGTMRAFTHEHRSYYEMERAHHIDEHLGAREESPIVRSA